MINELPIASDGYLPVAPLVGMAKLLVNAENRNEILTYLGRLYYELCRKPLSSGLIDRYLAEGRFFIELPKPETYDYKMLETLQRQALAALIAA